MDERALRSYFENSFQADDTPLSQIRRDALSEFVSRGFPAPKNEEYKYTPITKRLLKHLQTEEASVTQPETVPPFNEHLISELKGHMVVFWNGRLVFKSSDKAMGLTWGSIDDAEHSEAVKSEIDQVADPNNDAFSTLNTAFFNHGVYANVAAGTQLEEPIIVYHLYDGTVPYVQNRHLIVAEKGSACELIEIYKGIGDTQHVFNNCVTEISVASEAKVNYQKIQAETGSGIHVGNTHIAQDRQSQVACTTVSCHGAMIRNNLNIAVNGEHCETHMYGLYMLNGKTHVDNHTTVDHRVANCYSNELYKGIIDDKATGVFNGKIYVRQDAQKTNAFQSNKNLLLSDDASMNTKPQLEIWADDVKCSHGATTGQLDEEQMFYLRARGLDPAHARGLLLYAFAHETLEHVSSSALRSYLEEVIANRLYR